MTVESEMLQIAYIRHDRNKLSGVVCGSTCQFCFQDLIKEAKEAERLAARELYHSKLDPRVNIFGKQQAYNEAIAKVDELEK